MQFFRSLRFKIITPFIFGVALMAILLTWFTYSSAYNTVKEATRSVSESKVRNAKIAMNSLFTKMTQNSQELSTSSQVRSLFLNSSPTDYSWKKTIEWVSQLVKNSSDYSVIYIFDKSGICLISSDSESVGKSFKSKHYVKDALEGKFSFGDSRVGRVSKKYRAVCAGPIEINGKIVGALGILTYLPDIVDYKSTSYSGSRNIFISILNKEGLFITHPDNTLSYSGKTLFPNLYKELSGVGEQGKLISYTVQGKKYIGFALTDATTKSLIIASGLENEVFASAYRIGFIVAIVSFFFLFIISFTVIHYANDILKSLLSLIKYAEKVSAGNLSLDLKKNYREDELGTLQDALETLVFTLRTMLTETQQASKMKGDFLANMSHEIRTPLNAIIGLTYLATKDGKMDKKNQTYMDKISLSAKSLLALINNILDISKIEAGMIELEKLPFNLKDVIFNCVAVHEETALGKGLYLTVNYALDAEFLFKGDSLRIGQIISNLLSNALKFTEKGGITISCVQEKPRTEDLKVLLRISVKDTGIGMDKGVINCLFKPFVQADTSISRRFGGTGLGLAFSSSLVKLLDGTFDVTSVPGGGTTFSFTMLLEANPDASITMMEDLPLDTAFEQLQLQGKTILIVEDNFINQEIVAELIAPSGARILCADDGVTAIEMVKNNHVDFIFMDMQMPGMGGIEATTIIRKDFLISELPIVALTANAMKGDKEKSLECGMNNYLTKPIEPLQIIEMLTTYLIKNETKE